MISRWFKDASPKNRPQRRSAKLQLLTLEDRITPAVAFSLSGSNLLKFDTASPTITQSTPITNVGVGETLVGIDFRPQNGLLYGLTTTPVAGGSAVRLYTISQRTGVATPLTDTSATFVNGITPSTTPVPITGSNFGFDFNPAVDRIRVVTDTGFNFRMDPNTGLLIDGDISTDGVQPDGAQTGSTTTASAAAYTNNSPNSISGFVSTTFTTLYTLDAANNRLSLQNDPNAGTQTFVADITLNGQPLDFTAINGFDIPSGVNAPSNNAPATGLAFAALTTVATGTRLYTIDLTNGVATDLGPIGNGAVASSGLAVQSVQPGTGTPGTPLVGFSTSSGPGGFLSRFNSSRPADGQLSQAISGITTGETLVGFDFRPQTGQLFGLGINSISETGTLYRIDPQTRAATVVGTAGQVAFVDATGAAVDFPDPATTGYGFDFNPTVDRIRVTTGTGLNFRVNPVTGAPVDGNLNSGTPNGVNPDAALIGATTRLDALAYTNSFGQTLGVGPTTLYGLDSASNSLYIQSNPNAGTTTLVGPITVGGNPLDFSFASGFDIPASVRTATANAPVTSGFGFAALNVLGVNSLYQIDLTNGNATNLGTIGIGSGGPLSGLTAADTPDVVSGSTTAGVSGVLFVDYDADGIQDAVETGLAGRVVYLDKNANNRLDIDESSTATGAGGAYAFTGIAPGTYTLRLAAKGFEVGIGANGSGTDVVVAAGQTMTGINLGERVVSAVGPLPTDSQVFAGTFADNDSALVQGYYHALLGRAGQTSEAAFWVNALRTTSRANVVQRFIESNEFRTLEVQKYYRVILGREGEADGVAFAVKQMERGRSSSDVATDFLLSAEFAAATSSNQAFVEKLYRVLLSRDGETEGVASFTAQLNSGAKTRAQVIASFFESTESRNLALDSLFAQLLQRQADSAGQASFQSQLLNGFGLNRAIISILTSNEFNARRGQ